MKPCSLDLRERVVSAVHNGMSKTAASKTYKVCRQTVYGWLLLEKQTGSLSAKQGYQKGHSHGIKDVDVFRKFVDSHCDYTLAELGGLFSVDSSTVERTLKKLGYSRKKRAKLTQNAVRKSVSNIKKK